MPICAASAGLRSARSANDEGVDSVLSSYGHVEATARAEDRIDESLEETFPASDPPSWTAFVRIGSPK
jgi:hypothetical protein